MELEQQLKEKNTELQLQKEKVEKLTLLEKSLHVQVYDTIFMDFG